MRLIVELMDYAMAPAWASDRHPIAAMSAQATAVVKPEFSQANSVICQTIDTPELG